MVGTMQGELKPMDYESESEEEEEEEESSAGSAAEQRWENTVNDMYFMQGSIH